MFAEDYDMFAERRMLTKQQIIDEFYEYLSEKSGRGTARCNCSGVRPAQAHVPAQGGGVL